MYLSIALIAGCTLLYGCLADRIERSWLSGPLLFLIAGYLLGDNGVGLLVIDASLESVRVIAELTLAIVLFNDATGIGLRLLKHRPQIPIRTLLLGLPLTLLLGGLVAKIIFPQLSLIEAALIGIILAPTDAALGLAVIKNPMVPQDISRGLNAESGLNDGICVPFLVVCLALINGHANDGNIGLFALKAFLSDIGIGAIVGTLSSALGWLLCRHAIKQQWIPERWLTVPTISIALIAFSLAQALGGSGFIAAFCGGLLFGERIQGAYTAEMEESTMNGEILSLLTWLIFGALTMNILTDITWQQVAYGILSLTVIRMVPVIISLAGTSLSLKQKVFIGWFGPRGLASIVFAIMVFEQQLPNSQVILNIATVTILLSVLLHGISAYPASQWLVTKKAAR